MNNLEIAVSLALAGTTLKADQVKVINEATILDLIDIGLNFEDVEKLRAMTAIEGNRNTAQGVTFGADAGFAPVAEGKATASKMSRLLREEMGRMLDLEPIGSEPMVPSATDAGSELDMVDMMATEDELHHHDAPVDYTSDPGVHAKMSRQQLHTIMKSADLVQSKLSDTDQLPEWCRSHIAQAEQLIDSVAEYLDYKTLSGEMR
jgi:hypothetical protein